MIRVIRRYLLPPCPPYSPTVSKQAALAEQPLPAETRDYKLAWLKADQEASKSEYAFKLGLNYYNN